MDIKNLTQYFNDFEIKQEMGIENVTVDSKEVDSNDLGINKF